MKRIAVAVLLTFTWAVQFAGGQRAAADHWVATWGTAVVGRPADVPPTNPTATPPRPPLNFSNQTIRQIVRTSVGGDRVRVVFSNAFGTAPLAIGAAHVAVRDKESAIVTATDRALTFSGSASTTVPAGAVAMSDAVTLAVSPQADLAIDLYLSGDTAADKTAMTMHAAAFQTNYVSTTGNHTGVTELPVATTTTSWFLISRVEVTTSTDAGAIVAVGDSITDGSRSTANTNNRWPDVLARRLAAAGVKMGVANAGIGGNRVLTTGTSWGSGPNLLARFDRDALLVTGATHMIVLEGINDIGAARQNPSPSGADLIAGHRQVIARARARGLKVYGATLTPFEGASYFTAEGEAKRQALNTWIRTGNEYDGVIDFDAAVRDPKQPAKFLSTYDSGDGLHPNDAGMQAMAGAIDLKLFKDGRR